MQMPILQTLDLLGKLVAMLVAILSWIAAFKSTNWGVAIWATVLTYMVFNHIRQIVKISMPLFVRTA